MSYSNYLVVCAGALFAVLSPLATVPSFIAISEGDPRDVRLQMARRACIVAFLVLTAFTLTGLVALDFFGISIPAFKIAGGIILMRTSLEMVSGTRTRMTSDERLEAVRKEDISITPLAIPLLCGPVTIVTGILLRARGTTWTHDFILIGTILVIYLMTYILLRFSVMYSHLFGEITLRIVTRLMGLLLSALSVQFIVNGIRELELFKT